MPEPIPFPSAPDPSLIRAEDTRARELALNIRASCIVEAPAGSGKTALLVERFLKLLADPAAGVSQPEEVLAITFTNKATAELRERVLRCLHDAHSAQPLAAEASPMHHRLRRLALDVLERSQQLGWSLLAQPQRLNIRSLDSVCLLLSSALPLLTGSGAAPQPVEDADALYATAARRTLLRLGASAAAPAPLHSGLDDALRTLLAHRNLNLSTCQSLLAQMLAVRDQWGHLVPLTAELLPGSEAETALRASLEAALAHIVSAALRRASSLLPASSLAELATFAHTWSHLPGYTNPSGNSKPNPIALCADLPHPPQPLPGQLAHWLALTRLLISPSARTWRLTTRSMPVNSLGFKPPPPALQDLAELVQSLASDPLRAALGALLDLPDPTYSPQQWTLLRALFRVLRHALIELKLLFAERAQADFAEFSLTARAALESADPEDSDTPEASAAPGTPDAPDAPAPETAELALTSGGHLRHLLVDEMQDTSAGQYRLLELLTRSWDGDSQTVFFVGDPKQSIYLFREARVERFLRIMDSGRFGALTLETLRLTANFRSQAALVADFNRDLRRLLPESSTPQSPDVPFVEAFADRPESQPLGRRWHAHILGSDPSDPDPDPNPDPDSDSEPDSGSDPNQTESQRHAAAEARTIRSIIQARLDLPLPDHRLHPLQPWRIAVLGHTRSHLAAVIDELKRDHGRGPIPFRAVDLDRLADLPAILDLLALTRALLHPADRIAWLAVLRAPWCGLSLPDLLQLTGEGSLGDHPALPHATLPELLTLRSHRLSAEGQRLLARIAPVLSAARRSLGRQPLSVHLERTWRSLGADLALTPADLASALRYFGVLRDLEAQALPITPAAIEARLTRLFAASHPAQVELLTIHKAKGLEWDLVLVPALQRGTRREDARLLNWLELDDPDLPSETALVLSPLNPSDSPHRDDPASQRLNHWLNQLREQRQQAERRRLFYVASTRAREELHLFAAARLKSSGEGLTIPGSNSILAAVWPAAAAAFEPASGSADTADASADSSPANLLAFPVPAQPAGSARNSDADADSDSESLTLAAAAEPAPPPPPPPPPLTVARMPAGFHPSARFQALPPTPFAAAPQPLSARLDRPEGSFAVRAFGNVVHRYLQLLAERLAAAQPLAELAAELPSWTPRLTASLHAEGLSPTQAAAASARALQALTLTLSDPTGAWLLSPLPEAASERSIHSPTASLRVDRTFLAADQPLLPGRSTRWIIDFKTAEPGSRHLDAFLAAQLDLYAPQLAAYAAVRRALPGGDLPIRLGLYFPLIPALVHLPDTAPNPASRP